MMKKGREMSAFPRFILPGLAILGCLFMVVACFLVHREKMVGYLSIFAVDALAGLAILRSQKKRKPARELKL